METPAENPDRIPLATQRHLINNFKMATELGAEVIQLRQSDIAEAIFDTAEKYQATTVCLGKPHLSLFQIILRTGVFNQLLKKLTISKLDLVILS